MTLTTSLEMELLAAGYEPHFIGRLIPLTAQFEGINNLIEMWYREPDFIEKEAIMTDIKKLMDDCEKPAANAPKEWVVVSLTASYELEEELNNLVNNGYDLHSIQRDMGAFMLIGKLRK